MGTKHATDYLHNELLSGLKMASRQHCRMTNNDETTGRRRDETKNGVWKKQSWCVTENQIGNRRLVPGRKSDKRFAPSLILKNEVWKECWNKIMVTCKKNKLLCRTWAWLYSTIQAGQMLLELSDNNAKDCVKLIRNFVHVYFDRSRGSAFLRPEIL